MQFRISYLILPLAISYIALVILPWLGFCPVFQVSEGREGEVVNAILETGNYILPLRHLEIVPSKPPLFHWLGAFFAHLFAEYTEFELRLPSALAALGIAVSTFLLGVGLGGLSSGLVAVAILASTSGYLLHAADGRVDMLFTFFVVAAIARWILAYIKSFSTVENAIPSRVFYELGIICGLAILSKGPLGLLLPLLVIGTVVFFEHGFAGARYLIHPGWLTALIVSLPWYTLATMIGDDAFITRQVVFENLLRFRGGEGVTAKPWYFYLVNFWSHGAPWSFVLCVSLCWESRSWTKRESDSTVHGLSVNSSSARIKLGKKLALTWIISMVVFFSLSVGKRVAYLLPVLPAMAVYLSLLFNQNFCRLDSWFSNKAASKNGQSILQKIGNILLIFTIILVILFWFLGNSEAALTKFLSVRTVVFFQCVTEAFRSSPWTASCYLLFFSLSSLYAWNYSFRKANLYCLLGALFLYLELLLVPIGSLLMTAKGITHTYKDLAQKVTANVPSDVRLKFIKVKLDESFDGFFFYHKKIIGLHDPANSLLEPGYYLSRRKWLTRTFPEPNQQIREILSGGKLLDKPEDKIVLFEKLKG